MLIKYFFNPIVLETNRILYSKEKALEHCTKYYTYIRHYTFKSNQYIKNNGIELVWNDGSNINFNSLPNDNGWGKYYSELKNLCSF